MSALTVRLDRFVRWFFNSSPTILAIEPIEPGQAQKGEHANSRQAEQASVHGTRRTVRRPRSQPQARAKA